jgi:hypothetical protein
LRRRQHIVDESREPLGLAGDELDQRSLLLGRERFPATLEVAGGRDDRDDRRSKLVRQQRERISCVVGHPASLRR